MGQNLSCDQRSLDRASDHLGLFHGSVHGPVVTRSAFTYYATSDLLRRGLRREFGDRLSVSHVQQDE